MGAATTGPGGEHLAGDALGDIQQGTVAADLGALTAVQAQAEDGENTRRRLAANRPGHGAPVPLSEPPAGAGTGKPTEAGLMAGMGYSEPPRVSEAQVASYTMPNYAPDPVGGFDWPMGRNEAAIRRRVTNLGADGLFIEGRPSPVADVVTVASAPSRPPIWSRLWDRLRGRPRHEPG